MNILELSKKRFSARKFTDEAVSDDDLNYILEVVRMAPSAVNKQPWKFVIVKSDAARKRLQECYDREWIKSHRYISSVFAILNIAGHGRRTEKSMEKLM